MNLQNGILHVKINISIMGFQITQQADSIEIFVINKTLESNTGNSIGNGIVYLILCDLLDIPVNSIHIPQQFILAYFDEHYDILSPTKAPSPKISFYIDPLSGQMYSNKDVESYFNKLSLTPSSSYFKAMSNKMVIKTLRSIESFPFKTRAAIFQAPGLN